MKGGHGGKFHKFQLNFEYFSFHYLLLHRCILLSGNGYPKYGGIGGQGGCVAFEAQSKHTLIGLSKKSVI